METQRGVLIQNELSLCSFEASPQRTHEKGSLIYCWWKRQTWERKNREGKPGGKWSWKDNPENSYHHQLQHDLQKRAPALHRFALGGQSLQRQIGWTVSSTTSTDLEGSVLLQDPVSPPAQRVGRPRGDPGSEAFMHNHATGSYFCWKARGHCWTSIKEQQLQAPLVRIEAHREGKRGTALDFPSEAPNWSSGNYPAKPWVNQITFAAPGTCLNAVLVSIWL